MALIVKNGCPAIALAQVAGFVVAVRRHWAGGRLQ